MRPLLSFTLVLILTSIYFSKKSYAAFKTYAELRIGGLAGYDQVSIPGSSGNANFSGFNYGGITELKFYFDDSSKSHKGYSFGFNFTYEAVSSKNITNSATEQMSGSSYGAGFRFYALDVLLGGRYKSEKLNLTTSTGLSYSGSGVEIEAGYEIRLTNALLVIPLMRYEFMDLQRSNQAGKVNANGVNFGLNLMLAF